MRRPTLAALSGILVLALAGSAGATHGGIHPTFRTEKTYFHCVGSTKLQNISNLEGQIPSWNTTAPAGSVQAGHGCGYYDNVLNNATAPSDAVWEGKFAGNLKSLTVELHRLLPAQGATFPNRLRVLLDVDGENILNHDNVVIVPTASSTNASQSAKITITNLPYTTEEGDGAQERTIRLTARSFNETQSVWVFDTTEVPAGITFNPTSNSGTVVPVG